MEVREGMQLTRQGDYAMRVVYALAAADGEPLTQREVSRTQDVPEAFLAKIVQQLSRAGLVNSTRGARGGMMLARPAESITLREVVEAIEGTIALNLCMRGPGTCARDQFCSIHPVWVRAQEAVLEVLSSVTVAELVSHQGSAAPGFCSAGNVDKNDPLSP